MATEITERVLKVNVEKELNCDKASVSRFRWNSGALDVNRILTSSEDDVGSVQENKRLGDLLVTKNVGEVIDDLKTFLDVKEIDLDKLMVEDFIKSMIHEACKPVKE